MNTGKNSISSKLTEEIRSAFDDKEKEKYLNSITCDRLRYDGPLFRDFRVNSTEFLDLIESSSLLSAVIWTEAMGLIEQNPSRDYRIFIIRVANLWSTFRRCINLDLISHIRKYIDNDYDELRASNSEHSAVRFASFCLEATGTLRHPCFDKLFEEYMHRIKELV